MIKKFLFVLHLLILSISLFGCGIGANAQSTFKENFTIGTVVEDNAQYLIPGARVLSGSESGSSNQPFTQKKEEMVIQIEQTELPEFIAAIRVAIEESIIDSSASIDGHGSGGETGTSFSIQYREDKLFGVINVWGIRGEGTNFFLLVLITESIVDNSL